MSLNAKARLERYRHAFAYEGSQGSYQQQAGTVVEVSAETFYSATKTRASSAAFKT